MPMRLATILARRKHEPVEHTRAVMRALTAAAGRERGNICPIMSVHAAAESALIRAMDAKGFILWDGSVPRISVPGRAFVGATTQPGAGSPSANNPLTPDAGAAAPTVAPAVSSGRT